MKLLFFADVVGRPGREAVKRDLPVLRAEHGADVVIANCENCAGGIGVTPATARELLSAGADVLTSGNHVYKYREVYGYLDAEERILRPGNYPPGAPGHGVAVHALADGRRVAVINLMGRTYMNDIDCPFQTADSLLAKVPGDIRVRFVDFHAEATSEKKALAYHLDGRVSAVVGTHTHVQTSDAQVLPAGTAYLTDAGMCGVERGSVLGMDVEPVLNRFITGIPARFALAQGANSSHGAVVDVHDERGNALGIHIF